VKPIAIADDEVADMMLDWTWAQVCPPMHEAGKK
jgi:hypothetical protein